jgi:hypothetical protein
MMVDDDPLLDKDVNYTALSDLPVYVGTIQSCNNDKTMHDVSLEINNEVKVPIYIASPISTQNMVDNKHILDIDAMHSIKYIIITQCIISLPNVSFITQCIMLLPNVSCYYAIIYSPMYHLS